MSKRRKKLDTHFNLGYTVVGQSVSGTKLNNLYFGALAGDYRASQRIDVVGEFYGNTAASKDGTETGTTTEVAGAETVGMLGMRYRLRPGSTLFLALSRNNQSANLFRFGVTRNF